MSNDGLSLPTIPIPFPSSTLSSISLENHQLSSRHRLLLSAERLFAEHGIDAVGIRDIAADAGFKNANSLTYHFQTKENLVREVLRTGAILAENCRRGWLSKLHACGAPLTIRNVLKVLCAPTVEQAVTPSYALLARQMILTQSDFFFGVLGNDLIMTVIRCHDMLRNLLKWLPSDILEDRIRLCDLYISEFVATRHVHIRLGTDDGRWGSRAMIEHFLDSAEAILIASPSPQSLAASQALRAGQDNVSGSVVYNLFDGKWPPDHVVG